MALWKDKTAKEIEAIVLDKVAAGREMRLQMEVRRHVVYIEVGVQQ